MRTILFLICLASSAFAFDWQSEVQSGDFTDESHPASTTNINKTGNGVNFIQNGNWIEFAGFNFGSTSSVTNFWIQASKGTSTNSTLRLRLDSPTGPEIGSIQITQTGGWGDFQRFNLFFSQVITGTRDLYLICDGGAGYLFDLGAFRFQSVGYQRDGDLASVDYSAESHPNDATQIQKVGNQIQNIRDGNWVNYKTFDFADGVQYLWIEVATPNSGGAIHVRAGSPTGTILGTININSTGSWIDGVFVEGRKMDAVLIADPSLFQTSNISEFVFRDSPNVTLSTYNLLTSATTGSITLNPTGGVYNPGTVVTVSATPNSGYRFDSWSGDLAGTSNPVTITMDGNKSVTAVFISLLMNSTIDTTGGTTMLDYDAPQNKYIGNGTLRVSNDGDGAIALGTGSGTTPTEFAMTGGLITIDSGVSLVNGGWSKGIWTDNKADMQVNGTLDVTDGNPVRVNALNGAGPITLSYPWNSRATELHVGVNGGGGTFPGSIQEPHWAGSFVRIVKQGSGTQTFDNLANQKPGEIVINEGGVALLQDSDVTAALRISGAGSLTKSGAGTLTLSGALTYTGDTTVVDGILGIPQTVFADTSTVTIGLVGASAAVLHLPNAGTDIVARLIIDGVVQPGNGAVYNSSNSGGAITGIGTIQVGTAPTGYAAWVLSHGLTGGPNDEDDQDGFANIKEYAFGLLPTSGSSVNPITVPLATTTGTFSYTRRNPALTAPLAYSVWYSTTLEAGSWSRDNGAIKGTPVLSGEVETVPVTISNSLLTNPKLFIQVRAE